MFFCWRAPSELKNGSNLIIKNHRRQISRVHSNTLVYKYDDSDNDDFDSATIVLAHKIACSFGPPGAVAGEEHSSGIIITCSAYISFAGVVFFISFHISWPMYTSFIHIVRSTRLLCHFRHTATDSCVRGRNLWLLRILRVEEKRRQCDL